MTGLHERDRQVIAAVTCPVCHAKSGESCFYVNRWKRRTVMRHPHALRATAYAYKQYRKEEL